jgi:large subunit ribosomal protein L4
VWRHGGTVHGPQPRDYTYNFPRKKIRGALRSALSAKLGENSIAVVDAFDLETAKTRDFKKVLQAFGGTGKVLVVANGENRNLELSSRNLTEVKLVPGTGVNIKDVVNSALLIFSKDAILQVQEVLSR